MSFWPFLKSVMLAVALSPFVATPIGLAFLLVRGTQAIQDSGKVLIGLPFLAVVMLLLGGIPVAIGTTAVAGALTFVQRQIFSSPIPLWAIAAICLATIPFFLSRYPNGDGGSMQSMTESIKAMFAASVAVWCVIAALRPAGQA